MPERKRFFFVDPFPKEERVRPRFVAFWWSSRHCTMNIALAWHLICCFCFPSQKGFFALYIQARQSVLGHEIPDHVTQFATFGVGHVLGLIGHCSRTISCKIRGPPGPKHCQLQTSDLELIFRWRINQTLSDPNWRLYTGFCVNSVWSGWGVGAANPWQNLEADARTVFLDNVDPDTFWKQLFCHLPHSSSSWSAFLPLKSHH